MEDQEVATQIQDFEEKLMDSARWSATANDFGIVDDFSVKTNITKTTNIVTNYLRIKGHSISPMKVIDSVIHPYYFTFEAYFTYFNGKPIPTTSDSQNRINLSTDFVMDVYSVGSERHSIPVYTYQDLMSMQENAWYIQMANITLDSSFTPINVAVAGFNGNGYSIEFPNNLLVEGQGNVGLFGDVSSKTVLKNITVLLNKSTLITINSSSTINFGVIAGNNSGTITNCVVKSLDNVTLTVAIQTQTDVATSNYVAGLIGYNNGFVTNSRVELNIIANANLAGFVGVNSKLISSSYVKNSSIINNSGESSNNTAGFVVKNGASTQDDAIIDCCYVVGEYDSSYVYSSSKNKILRSDPPVAGFAFYNYSAIQNSYSDIFIISQSLMAGFVFYNAGSIENTYSTTTFNESGQVAHGYLYKNNIDNNSGTVVNSYYLLGKVNSLVNQTILNGVTALSESQFSQQSRFNGFIFGDSLAKDQGIWFYPSKGGETFFLDNGVTINFTYGRPEIVSANILAYSQKAMDSSNIEYDPITGQTNYVYYETKNAEGSKYNPYVITSAQSFEDEVYNTSVKNVNTKYFRLACDIDYSAENINNSKIYKTIFKGNLEGNLMTIKGYVIDSIETLQNGGLFAQVGQGTTGEGLIKNLYLKPKYINLPNASNVGSLAGSLESGKIYNVSVDGFNYDKDGLVIMGHNCVGGVVGVAKNSFTMVNINSSVSARASYNSASKDAKLGIYTSSSTKDVSYSGAIAGVAHSHGTILGVTVEEKIASIAEIAGSMFGKIGDNVSVSNVNINLEEKQFVRATYYGGVIAGELTGVIDNANISGAPDINFFNVSPIVTTAVGGAVGFMSAGQLNNVVCNINLIWNIQSPDIVGGIVGECIGGKLNNCQFNGDIKLVSSSSYSNLLSVFAGGIVGKIAGELTKEPNRTIYPGAVTLNSCSTNLNSQNQNTISVVSNSIYNIQVGSLVGTIVTACKDFNEGGTEFKTTLHQYTINGCTGNMFINVSSTLFGGVMNMSVGGLIGSIYADSASNGGGEVVIYDAEAPNVGKYQSVSHSKVKVAIKDMKDASVINLNYGGILGHGYAVDLLTIIEVEQDNTDSWSELLSNELRTQNQTHPDYDGKDEAGSWAETIYCDLSGVDNTSSNVIIVENR